MSADCDRGVRHNHPPGEACRACLAYSVQDAVADKARADEVLATARRVTTIYQRRNKEFAAVLLDVRGLVRGMDSALDDRIDAVLGDGGFLPSTTVTAPANRATPTAEES